MTTVVVGEMKIVVILLLSAVLLGEVGRAAPPTQQLGWSRGHNRTERAPGQLVSVCGRALKAPRRQGKAWHGDCPAEQL